MIDNSSGCSVVHTLTDLERLYYFDALVHAGVNLQKYAKVKKSKLYQRL